MTVATVPSDIPDYWQARYQKHKQKSYQRRNNAKIAALPFTIITVISISLMGAWATYLIFPWLTIWAVPPLFATGLVIDWIFYNKNIQNTFKLIFKTGVYSDLRRDYEIKMAKSWLTSDESRLETFKTKTFKTLFDRLKQKYLHAHYPHIENESTLDKETQNKINNAVTKLFTAKLMKYFARQRHYKNKYTPKKFRQLSNSYLNDFDNFYAKEMKERGKKMLSGQATLRLKYFLATVSILFASITAVSWICVTFVEFLEITAIVSFANPFAWAILALAVLVGFAQGFMFFNMLHKGIKNNIFKKIGKLLSPEKNKSILINCLKITLSIIAIALVAISSLIMTDAFLTSMTEFFVMTIGKINTVTDIIMQIAMYINIISCELPFAIKHSIGACQKLANYLHNSSKWLMDKNTKWNDISHAIKTNPLKIVVFSLVFVSLIVHGISEGAILAVKGAVSDKYWPGKFFRKIANLIRVNPNELGASIADLQETSTHLNFVFKFTNQVTDKERKNDSSATKWLGISSKPYSATKEPDLDGKKIKLKKEISSNQSAIASSAISDRRETNDRTISVRNLSNPFFPYRPKEDNPQPADRTDIAQSTLDEISSPLLGKA